MTLRARYFDYFEDLRINWLFKDDTVIVFDLNGLIIDDEPLQMQATNAAINEFGIQISESRWIDSCVGHRPREYIPRLLDEAGYKKVTSEVTESIIRRKDTVYRSYIQRSINSLIRPGVTSLIDYCEERGFPLALASGTTKSGVEAILGLKGLCLINRFTYAICGDQVIRSKPDPEIYLKVRAAMGKKRNYVALEDSFSGVEAATRAGMKCIAVPNRYTFTHNLAKATLRLNNLETDAKIIPVDA